METTLQFLKKRYVRTLGFALPVVVVCIVTGMLLNLLDDRLTQQQSDTIGEVVICTLLTAMTLVIFWRKPLPSILGRWQKMWNSIPTWQQHLNERQRKQ